MGGRRSEERVIIRAGGSAESARETAVRSVY